MAKAQEGLEGIDVSELGKRRWCVMGDPEDGGGSRSIQTASSFRAIGSMTERAGTSTARSPSRAVRLLSAAAAPQKEDSRASAHRPRPLFELQDLGSVYTKSRKRDFSIHFHLAPERLSEP